MDCLYITQYFFNEKDASNLLYFDLGDDNRDKYYG